MRRKGTDQKRRVQSEPPVMAYVGVTRREWIFLGAVLAVGICLRVVAFSRSAVEHFDEGVYASNIYFGGPEYAYPLQRYYAPPLLPALIEAGMIVGLPPNVAALLPSFLAGCATIVAVWWFGRTWFGPAVGLSAATLVAFNDFHIAFSAAALTDALLGLWLVLAVDAVGRSLVDRPVQGGDVPTDGRRLSLACASGLCGDLRWAVAAGIFTGLAWWTKYNGWLPLAIVGAAMPVLWVFLRPPAKQWMSWLGCFAVTCVVACAVWSPYYFSLQSQGGYGPIAANHAKYVVGLAGWLDSALQQLANQATMEGPLSKFGVFAALMLPAIFSPGPLRRNWMQAVAILSIGLAALLMPTMVVAACSAGVGLGGTALAILCEKTANDAKMRVAIGLALVIAWWLGLLLATPFYSPYPRLLLPWLLASWLGAAIYWGGIWQARELNLSPVLDRTVLATLIALLVAAGVFWTTKQGSWNRFSAPADRRGTERIAREVRAMRTKGELRAIYTYGEPALYFQLRTDRDEVVAPVQQVPRQAAMIDGKAVQTFLIVGPHAEDDPQFQQQWAAERDRFELSKTFDYSPSAIAWLDLHDPRKGAPEAGDHGVRLYRLKP